MFDLGWSKLIIIAMLAIVVVGPKELPGLLRTIGKFVGQIRRQADEFRRQFEEAMRDTELDQIRKDVEDIKRTAHESVRDIERSAEESVQPLENSAAEITQLGNGAAEQPAPAPTSEPELAADAPAAPAIPAAIPSPSLTKTGA